MDGLHITRAAPMQNGGKQYLQLLAEVDHLQVMRQTILPQAAIWLSPAEQIQTLELFYVISGELTLFPQQASECTICAGDCFYVRGLDSSISISTQTGAEILYLVNTPVYANLHAFHGEMERLLKRVEAKDRCTYGHGRRVMQFAMRLWEEMRRDCEQTVEALSAAALFHDIGKCFLPDEILLKAGALTDEEYTQVKRHPEYSCRLLHDRFGERVGQIVLQHHERMDGSGYPNHLQGDQILLEARIIAVADSFDAMTSQRNYNQICTPFAAVEDMEKSIHKYDQRVVAILRRLIETGELPEGCPRIM